MPEPFYSKGSNGRAFIVPKVGTAPTVTEIAVSKWDLTIDGDILKFDNNKDGRWRQEGNVDASGSLMMFWDPANRQSDFNTTGTLPNIRAGSVLDLQLREDGSDSTSPTDSFRLRVIIEKPKISSEFAGTMDYECSFMLQTGIVRYPGDT